MFEDVDDLESAPARRIEFHRIEPGTFYAGNTCPNCGRPDAEFEYALWFDNVDEPSDTGALCGVCAAVMLLQESSVETVVVEKTGLMVTASKR